MTRKSKKHKSVEASLPQVREEVSVPSSAVTSTTQVAEPFRKCFMGGLSLSLPAAFFGLIPWCWAPYAGLSAVSAMFMYKHPREFIGLGAASVALALPFVQVVERFPWIFKGIAPEVVLGFLFMVVPTLLLGLAMAAAHAVEQHAVGHLE